MSDESMINHYRYNKALQPTALGAQTLMCIFSSSFFRKLRSEMVSCGTLCWLVGWPCILKPINVMAAPSAPSQAIRATLPLERSVASAVMLEQAYQLIFSDEMAQRLKHSERIERLKSKCLVLRYKSHPQQSLSEARSLKEPFYASLALGGMAAILQKSDPSGSEKLFAEAEQLALKITHYSGEDPSSIGYLYRLIPRYDAPRARRLWENAAPALFKWDSYGHRSSHGMRELSLVVIQVNPEEAETFWKTYIAPKHHYWDSAEILGRAIVKQSPAAARKRLDHWLEQKASGHNVTAFRRALLAEYALKDFAKAMAWIQNMRPSDRLDAAFDLTLLFLYTGRNAQAQRVLEYFEKEAKEDLAKGGGGRGAMWLGDLIPRLRERIRSGFVRSTKTVAMGDTLDASLDGSRVPVATPDMIEAFLANPQIQNSRRYGGIPILGMPQIQLKDDDQAARLLGKALPLADKVMDAGYPHHGSPRSQMLGALALIEATRGNPQRARDLIARIDVPELKAFYLIEAVEILDPLPKAVRGWPLEFWRPTTVRIGQRYAPRQ
jgi:hypothetical protein